MTRFATLAAVALCTALAVPVANAQTAEGNVVRMVMHAPLRVLDPIFTNAYITRNHGYLVYDTLFALDAKGKPQPQMVDSFTVSKDQLTYTFKLRAALKFHDGTPVTSEDVIASLQRWEQVDVMGKRLHDATQSISPVNPTTFSITLKHAFGMVLDSLARPSSYIPFIMPKRLAQTPATTALTEVVGSGPYKFVASEFKPGVKAVYLKNTDYLPRKEPASNFAGGKVAAIDRLEVINMPDAQTAVNALKKGEIDYIESVPADLAPQLEGVRNVTVEPKTNVRSTYVLRMNWLQPPLDNVKVRRAALAALNEVDYLDAAIGDPKLYIVCGSVFSCASPYKGNEGAPQVSKPDPAKARALLKDSGYKGEKIVVMHSTDLRSMVNIAPITVQALRGVGFNVEMQSMDWNTMLARRSKKDPLDKGGWSIFHSLVSTLDLVNPVANTNLDGRGDVPTGWPKDEVMEKLRDQYAAESDDAKRAQIATAIQKRAYELVFFVPLGEGTQFRAFNPAKAGALVDAEALVVWTSSK